mgnify:CR=1 FL=1
MELLNPDYGGKYPGKYKGFIRDNNDPEGRGRLRVYCPQVMGSADDKDHWLDWAEPCFPWLGGLSTLDFGVPPVPSDNDDISVGVWIEFENQSPDFPIWVGTFVYAPVRDGVHSKIDDEAAASPPGGSLFAAVESGRVKGDIDDFNPVRPRKDKETRLVVKAGRDIVLMSDREGAIVIGPNGVNIQGAFVRANGRLIEADIGRISG